MLTLEKIKQTMIDVCLKTPNVGGLATVDSTASDHDQQSEAGQRVSEARLSLVL